MQKYIKTRSKQLVRQFFTLGLPKVAIISIPKSGTHLLAKMLNLFPRLYRCPNFKHVQREPTNELLKQELAKMKQGQFVTTHLLPLERINNILVEFDLKKIFIYRDPRDIAVSEMFYITYKSANLPQPLPGHEYFKALPDDAERLKQIIIGTKTGRFNIAEWLNLYESWFAKKDVYRTTYEKAVGPNGGGTLELQQQEIKNIAEHLAIKLSSNQFEAIVQGTYSRKAGTFRKGKIGDWQNHFTKEHKDLFKQVAGQILIDWNYEKGFDW